MQSTYYTSTNLSLQILVHPSKQQPENMWIQLVHHLKLQENMLKAQLNFLVDKDQPILDALQIVPQIHLILDAHEQRKDLLQLIQQQENLIVILEVEIHNVVSLLHKHQLIYLQILLAYPLKQQENMWTQRQRDSFVQSVLPIHDALNLSQQLQDPIQQHKNHIKQHPQHAILDLPILHVLNHTDLPQLVFPQHIFLPSQFQTQQFAHLDK